MLCAAIWLYEVNARTSKQANGLRTRWIFIQMPGRTIRSTYFLVVIVLHVHTNDKCHFLLFLKNMHFYHSIIFMQSICICVSVSLTCIALFISIQQHHHHHQHWRRFSCLSHARPKEIITNFNSTKKICHTRIGSHPFPCQQCIFFNWWHSKHCCEMKAIHFNPSRWRRVCVINSLPYTDFCDATIDCLQLLIARKTKLYGICVNLLVSPHKANNQLDSTTGIKRIKTWILNALPKFVFC